MLYQLEFCLEGANINTKAIQTHRSLGIKYDFSHTHHHVSYILERYVQRLEV